MPEARASVVVLVEKDPPTTAELPEVGVTVKVLAAVAGVATIEIAATVSKTDRAETLVRKINS